MTIEQKPMEKQNPIVVDEGTELKSKAGNPKVPSMTTPPYQATVENSNDASTIESSSAESEKVVVLSKDVEDKKFRKNKEQQNLDAQEDHSLCENVVVAKHNDDGHGVIKLIGEKNLDQPAQDLQKHVPPQPLVSIQSSFGSTEKTSENRKLVEKEGEKPKRKHFITFFNKKAFLPVKKPPQKKVKFFKKGQIDANEHPICDGPDHHRLPGFLPPALKVAPGEYILPPAFEIEQVCTFYHKDFLIAV